MVLASLDHIRTFWKWLFCINPYFSFSPFSWLHIQESSFKAFCFSFFVSSKAEWKIHFLFILKKKKGWVLHKCQSLWMHAWERRKPIVLSNSHFKKITLDALWKIASVCWGLLIFRDMWNSEWLGRNHTSPRKKKIWDLVWREKRQVMLVKCMCIGERKRKRRLPDFWPEYLGRGLCT